MALSRRNVAKLIGMGGALAASPGIVLAARPRPLTFPKGFRWGCATSAYQIEGAVAEDGRGETNWDVFSRIPGKIKEGGTGDIACDSYHRFEEDTQLLKGLGANSYRLSFAWSRIFPEGRGAVNRLGLDHYHRMIDNLLENGIEPFVTLFHWDLPAALDGGWQSRDTAQAFADYAALVSREFSDRVHQFMTINEVRSFIDTGYGGGGYAPGLRLSAGRLNQARHHALLAHGLGVQAIRANSRAGTKVGIADNPIPGIPAIESEPYITAAKKMFRSINAGYLVPVMEGAYPAEWLTSQGANAPKIQDGDMRAIGSPIDFVGVNVYTGLYVEPSASPQGFQIASGGANTPHMGLGWLRVVPESTYWAIRLISELWKPKAIYISENGTVAADRLQSDEVHDSERVMYLRSYVGQMQRAASEGYPIKGYFLWSLLDNFEWSEGYTARFGLHYVDFKTQKRIPKLSAKWFKEVIRRNAVV